jgi:hypothetical protein
VRAAPLRAVDAATFPDRGEIVNQALADLLIGTARWSATFALTLAAAARLAGSAFAARPRGTAEHYLQLFLASTLACTAPVVLLGFAGRLHPNGLLLFAAALFLASRALPRAVAGPAGPRASEKRRRLLLLPLVLALGLIAVDLPIHLASPPSNWDAMTYHLHFPARWIQEGHLHHIPTVFSDNASAFAPQNGALLFAWSMALLGSDALSNVLQFAALAAIGCAVHRLARMSGVGPLASALAGATVVWIQPLRRLVASANVDAWMLAFWIMALAWLATYLRRPRVDLAAACGLAAGLAAGTKTIGLTLALLLLPPFLLVALVRRRPAHLALWIAAATLGGGWWYVRNAVLYGNPLFPLELRAGPWTLRGAYDLAALRAGEFHVGSLGGLLERVYDRWQLPLCLLLAAGFVALGWRSTTLSRRRGAELPAATALLLLAEGFAVLLWYAFLVPHNSQTRFLLPALLLALVGWAGLLDRAGRRRRWASWALAAGGIVALALAGRPEREWLVRFEALRQAQVALLPLAIAVGLSYSALALRAVACRRAWRAGATGLLVAAALGTLALGVRSAEISRPSFLTRTNFRAWSEGFLALQDPALAASRVAYSGANIPYALAGPRFRHRVVYCNTRGEADDGFYEFWQRDPRTYPYHKPGIYRGPDERYELWLEHLERERIELVVLFALHTVERRYLPSTAAGFPPEQQWIARHPERFQPLLRGRKAEIYRLRSRDSATAQ